jgi:hypothetical protein
MQTFIQRSRLGLDPGFPISLDFTKVWERRFVAFHIWEACKRREMYRENWIDWDELQKARKTEAFQFLENELRQSTLTSPVSGGLEWWAPDRWPPHTYPSPITLQAHEPSKIHLFDPGLMSEGLVLWARLNVTPGYPG